MFEDVAKAIRETSGAYEALVSQTEQDA